MALDLAKPEIKELFCNATRWIETFLRDPSDKDKPIKLKHYQKEITDVTRTERKIVLRYGRRCLPGHMPVLLSDGTYKAIKDIKVGDSVVSRSDKGILTNRIVTDTYINGIKPIYNIRLSDGRNIECTSNHPLLVEFSDHYKWLSIETGLKCGINVVILNDNNEFENMEITNITYINDNQTYDITVEIDHNFVVNGIVTHNTGKSVTLCCDTLWWAVVSPLVEIIEGRATKQQPIKVLIATPYQTQIKMLWNMYLSLIGNSPFMKDQLVKVRTSDVYVLEFKNGSVIEGYTIGISSSNKGTSLRGLDANVLFIDEMDAIPREIIDEVLMPIWTGHPDCKLRVSSTPTGERNLFYDICTRADELGWFHRHYPSWNEYNDRWISIEKAKQLGMPVSESTEFQVKSITPHEIYIREYGAEFGESFGGVYKHHLIDKCLVKYTNKDHEDPDIFDPGFEQNLLHKYIIGVDWNTYINGGQVVMLEYCSTPTIVSYFDHEKHQEVFIDFTNKYRLFYRRGVKVKDATQRQTRTEIINLLRKYKVDFIYVDYGAGDTNIEELTHYGKQYPDLKLSEKLRVIDSGSVVEHYDPILRTFVKKRNKSLMVNFSVLSCEENMFILPKEEDTPTKLVGQMRGYSVKTVSARGELVYGGLDHILDAFHLAVYGFQQNFGYLLNQQMLQNIQVVADPRNGVYPIRGSESQTPIIFGSNKPNYRDPEYAPKVNRPNIFDRGGTRSISFTGKPFGSRRMF